MRPDQNDAPDRDTAGSLADGREDVATSTEPFGDDVYDEEVFDEDSYGEDSYGDDSYDEDSEGDDSYEEDVFEDDGGFGDGSTEPVEDDGGVLVPDEDTAVVETADPELSLEAHDNDPLEGVGYLIEELKEALLGEDGAGGDVGGASPFDADPTDVASDTDLDLTGDGLVDGHDLDEAGSVLDVDVTDG